MMVVQSSKKFLLFCIIFSIIKSKPIHHINTTKEFALRSLKALKYGWNQTLTSLSHLIQWKTSVITKPFI